ncbi:MAG TPA: EamA family transporter, partial [Mycobacteriales bacterium]|nr:EamA family transporter [Mycobacteriales bacterium]
MRPPAPTLAIASMALVQLGAALSTHLFDAVTPAGSAWLRLSVAGVVLLALTRPRGFSRRTLLATVVLGAVTGLLTLAFIEAVARVPLGTAVAIEFLGPVVVAGVTGRGWRDRIGIALAAGGVVLLAGVQLDEGLSAEVVIGLVAILGSA